MTHSGLDPAGAIAIVLGTAQDGAVPQSGCGCCACLAARVDPARARRPSCLGLLEEASGSRFMVDATWQFPDQLQALNAAAGQPAVGPPDGILLTHAHVGHYAGLVHLGREVMASHEVPLWVMPRMAKFLSSNQPWASLVEDHNVVLQELTADRRVELGSGLSVRPVPVPHRDELSETVAFEITGPSRRVLWLPDIDVWDERLGSWLADVDVAWLDGTFFSDAELPGRDIQQIPHPRVSEHLQEYSRLADEAEVDLRLIHLNHSNPLCDPGSPESLQVEACGVKVAAEGERVQL